MIQAARINTHAGTTIAPYQPAHHAGAVSVITDAQEEFGIAINYASQPDLDNIENFYQKASGNFWVALDGDHVIGTIALLDAGQRIGIIRKMFLHPECRGDANRTAQRLFDTLLAWARQHDFQHIYLGTIDKFQAAARFYLRNGFALIDKETLPDAVKALRMKIDTTYYHLPLHEEAPR